jgi:hypothetical protein
MYAFLCPVSSYVISLGPLAQKNTTANVNHPSCVLIVLFPGLFKALDGFADNPESQDVYDFRTDSTA